VIMRAGQVIADGLPSEILRVPNHELLATTGLTAPPAARIADALGLGVVPASAAALLNAIGDETR